MIKAFISYSSAQKTFAEEIAKTLGYDNCFIDNSSFENGMKTIDPKIRNYHSIHD